MGSQLSTFSMPPVYFESGVINTLERRFGATPVPVNFISINTSYINAQIKSLIVNTNCSAVCKIRSRVPDKCFIGRVYFSITINVFIFQIPGTIRKLSIYR
jgi:hypothetical protein